MQTLREVTKKLQLAVNEDKTRICRVPAASFDFLGYTFGRCYSHKTGKAYLGTTPSKKSIKRICDAMHNETGRHTMTQSAEKLVKKLNAKLSGWANYFRLGPVSRPIRRSTPTPAIGCASGYAESTATREKGRHATLTSTSTKPWGWSDCRG